MFKKLLFSLIALMALGFSNQTKAQDDSLHHNGCGFNADYLWQMGVDSPSHGATAMFTTPALFPAYAKDTCGKFIIYYEDKRLRAPKAGFSDPALGATRRATLCAALTYIQTVFDFSNIPANNYIRLHVDTSWSPLHKIPPFPSLWEVQQGVCAPYFKKASATYGAHLNGFVHDYITSSTGTDPNPGDYHANLQINFYKMDRYICDLTRVYILAPPFPIPTTISYNDGMGACTGCQFDLNSILLHLVSHSLGWFSWQDVDATHGVSSTRAPLSNYDTGLCIIRDPLMTSNPFTSIGKLLPTAPFMGRAMLNKQLPPKNSFIFDKDIYTGISEFSHLNSRDFSTSSRITPCDIYYPVMAIPFEEGRMIREYSKIELLEFRDIIGLPLKTSFSTSHSVLLNNRLAWCSKMNSDTYNFDYYKRGFVEKVNPDFTMTNNISSSIVINLGADTSLHDEDGDILSVMSGSLVNFRGCGDGGNNHNRLVLSSSDRTITYTPRHNFYGRAQFGFNLWDGKEKGAFVVYTIEVLPGNNVSAPMGSNMIVNGDFEEGDEVKLLGTSEDINNTPINGPLINDWGRFNYACIMSDGHPYDTYTNHFYGTAIRGSYGECSYASKGISFGNPATTFPWSSTWTMGIGTPALASVYGGWFSDGFPDATVTGSTNNRYQPLGHDGILFNLADTLKQCRRYMLEFDVKRTYTTPRSTYTAAYTYPTMDTLTLDFTESSLITDLSTIGVHKSYSYLFASMDDKNWQHLRVSFTYCAPVTSNVMRLKIAGALSDYEHIATVILDNVKLTEMEMKPTVKIIDSQTGSCTHTLYAGPPSAGCPTLTYTWRNSAGTIIATSRDLPIAPLDTTTYYATVYDGCSSASDTITIYPCRCSPVKVFGTKVYTSLPSSIGTPLSAGYYHATSDILVTTSSAFSNAHILIEPNVKITVAPNAVLSIDNSHLFVCPDTNMLWKGIELLPTANIEVLNNSLIEDAETAINANNPALATGSTQIIKTEDAVFNRNRTAIAISNYAAIASTYPFNISKTAFTARALQSFSGYPIAWPSCSSLRTTFANSTATAPYQLCRDYLSANNKNNIAALAGISLNNIGSLSGGTFYGIQIGGISKSADRNLFDNVGDGINALNSNFTVYNSCFSNNHTTPIGLRTSGMSYPVGTGIYATKGLNRKANVSYATGVNEDLYNQFYDCTSGVKLNDYSVANIYRNLFNSSNTNPTAPIRGIEVNVIRYDSMIINGNKLYNIPTAIYHSSSTGSLGYILGRTRIINNLVRPELESPVLTSGSESVLQGIEVVSSVSSVSGAVKDNILIQGNNLQRVFNGVKFSNCTQQRVLNMTNNISLQYQSPTALQYGIYAANNYNALCYGNQVSGIGAVASDDRKRAFYNASNRLNTLDCNHAIHTGRGFDFDGIQPQTYWKGNSMEDHRMGMALGGPIDQQGKPDYAILNQWNGTWSSPTYNQTLCYAYTNPTLSRLFVKNNLIENPTANFDNPTYKRYDATSLITTLHAYDDPCATSSSYTPIPIGKLSTAPLIHFIKSGNVDYGSNNDINAWMGQMSLYRFIHEDDSFHYQSNNAFVSFAAMADNARFGWLSHIEDALASGNTSLAQSLLNQPVAAKGNIFVDSTLMLTDTSAADTIVAHYVQFYNQYLSYLLSGNTDSTVLASLAYLCPRLHGAVVYQARAFYTQRYGINTVYNDDSLCMSAPSRIAYPDAPIASQDYTLYPNPNNGTFVLKQKTNADKKVLLKVYNALGVIVYQSEISFINGQINVGMGQKTPGVYLICIGDEMAKTVCLRFIIH